MTNTDTTRTGGVNGTVAFITVSVLVALGITGSFVILLVNPEAHATFTNSLVVVLGLVVSFAGTVGIVRPIAKRLERVEGQTNGRLTAAAERQIKLEQKIIEMGGNPHD